MKEYCKTCNVKGCELRNQVNFCEDCADYSDCPIRDVYCEKGYAIECSNCREYVEIEDYFSTPDDDDEGEDDDTTVPVFFMNKTKKLLEILMQYPDLPIIPMVDSDLWSGEDYGWFLGSIWDAEVTEYITLELNEEERVFTRVQQHTIEAEFVKEIAEGIDYDLHKTEIDKIAHDKAEALSWKKAIIVWVGTPNAIQ